AETLKGLFCFGNESLSCGQALPLTYAEGYCHGEQHSDFCPCSASEIHAWHRIQVLRQMLVEAFKDTYGKKLWQVKECQEATATLGFRGAGCPHPGVDVAFLFSGLSARAHWFFPF